MGGNNFNTCEGKEGILNACITSNNLVGERLYVIKGVLETN